MNGFGDDSFGGGLFGGGLFGGGDFAGGDFGGGDIGGGSSSDGSSSSSVPYGLTSDEKKQIEDVFDLFVVSTEGGIHKKELRAAMCALGFEFDDNEIKTMRSKIGTAGKCYVTLDEFKELLAEEMRTRDSEAEVKKAFDIFDDDETGFITARNIKRVLKKFYLRGISDNDIEEIINNVSQKGDNRINCVDLAKLVNSYASSS